jgi:outer membrane biogenesis lipoprotein LolB
VTRLASLAAVLLVAACAGAPPAPIALDGLPESFEMAGRLSVAKEGQGDIFRLRWRHGPQSDAWVLATPLGTDVARIERAAGGLVLHRPGVTPMEASSLAELTQHVLGAALDERLLVAWLHGRPVAGPAGWAVTIDESQRFGASEVARRVTAAQGEVIVKLVVDSYRVQPE